MQYISVSLAISSNCCYCRLKNTYTLYDSYNASNRTKDMINAIRHPDNYMNHASKKYTLRLHAMMHSWDIKQPYYPTLNCSTNNQQITSIIPPFSMY